VKNSVLDPPKRVGKRLPYPTEGRREIFEPYVQIFEPFAQVFSQMRKKFEPNAQVFEPNAQVSVKKREKVAKISKK
jgi:hypothetical protein